jgi:site-specific recombinase XerD
MDLWSPRARSATVAAVDKPRLLDQIRDALRARHYSPHTEQAYLLWVRRFIYFHQLRHPAEMGQPEINAFLTHLAVRENVSASTQNQALAALLFLYGTFWLGRLLIWKGWCGPDAASRCR